MPSAPPALPAAGRIRQKALRVAILTALLVAGIRHATMVVPRYAGDFPKFYAGARALEAGRNPYAPQDDGWHNVNPPFFLVFTRPLAELDPSAALATWRVLDFAALVAALVLAVPRAMLRSWRAIGILVALVWAPSFVLNSWAGQFSGWLALLVTLAWRAASAGRPVWEGAALGLLIGLKPFLVTLVVPAALDRRWRVVAASGLWAFASFACGLAVWGWPTTAAWLEGLQRVFWIAAPMNASWPGLVARVSPAPLSAALTVAGLAAIGGISAAVLRGAHDQVTRLLLAGLAGLLLSPLGWVYSILALSPLLVRWALAHPWPVAAWLLWVPLPVVMLSDLAWVQSSYALGALGLWIGLVRRARAAAEFPGSWGLERGR